MKIYLIKTATETKHLSTILFPLVFKRETGRIVSYDELPRSENGKPEPIDDIYFNISHSGKYWCVVFSDAECGVDIEVNRQLNPRIAKKILYPNEQLIDGDLLKNWVIKEAYAKMTGAGIGIGLNTINPTEIANKYTITDLSKDDYTCYAIGNSSVGETIKLDWNGVELFSTN